MASKPSVPLRKLEKISRSYGGDFAAKKSRLLTQLAKRRLESAKEVFRFHEILCFLKAYPDDGRILDLVKEILDAFEFRGDLRRYAADLISSGIAGTPISFPFFWSTAQWLVKRWPENVFIDWEAFDNEEAFHKALPLLVPYSETPALDMLAFSPSEWLDELKGDETDAVFLVKRIEAMPGDSFTREVFFDGLDIPLKVVPGPNTPSRSTANLSVKEIAFQTGPLATRRPSLRAEIMTSPVKVRLLSPAQGRRMINLAREAMVTRSRDLDAFAYGDPNDVRIADCGDGLQFACVGMIPERRLLLESVYGYLMLQNGVPVGYLLTSSLFKATEITFNIFDSYRGGEAAKIFGRMMGTVHRIFDSDAFSVDPFQLGYNNEEGLLSGVWWFYYKLGFRPEDPGVRRDLRVELKKIKSRPGYRTSLEKLEQLASEYMFFFLNEKRRDTLAHIELGEIGLGISRTLSERFGAEREAGLAACVREAAKLLGVRTLGSFSRGERLAWERWSPLVLSLRGVSRWPAADKKHLARVIRAKGGRRESDYVLMANEHHRLKRALLRLAEGS